MKEQTSNKEKPPSATERAKRDSESLRGALAEEYFQPTTHFSSAAAQVLKHHGIYQQDDRDLRGSGQKDYSYFVRTRLPGGLLTAQQFLSELKLCDDFGNQTLRITDRQGFQIHGVVKSDIRPVIRGIHKAKATTYGACGDVLRNVMCCPAPQAGDVRSQMQQVAKLVSASFTPQSRAYWELWLRDGEESRKVAESEPDEEPFYGPVYLPRKFKIGFALPDDNCIDVLTHDLGFVAIVEQNKLVGFNAYVGGGMGVTPARADTFAAVAQPFAFVSTRDVLLLAKTVIATHRDFGNRTDRKLSRIRYLIADWGLERFFHHVDEQMGGLKRPREQRLTETSDHLGWHADGSGQMFLGLYIASGRIADTGDTKVKSGLRAVATRFNPGFRVTPHQNLLLCGIAPEHQRDVTSLLREFGVSSNPSDFQTHRLTMACPALPTCGLAITESERAMPSVLRIVDGILGRHGLSNEMLSIRATGCPNGCTRPYVAEIGIVGKTKDRYTLFLGGSRNGTRIAFRFLDSVPISEFEKVLEPVFVLFVAKRQGLEPFGDFCHRVGLDYLQQHASNSTAV